MCRGPGPPAAALLQLFFLPTPDGCCPPHWGLSQGGGRTSWPCPLPGQGSQDRAARTGQHQHRSAGQGPAGLPFSRCGRPNVQWRAGSGQGPGQRAQELEAGQGARWQPLSPQHRGPSPSSGLGKRCFPKSDHFIMVFCLLAIAPCKTCHTDVENKETGLARLPADAPVHG